MSFFQTSRPRCILFAFILAAAAVLLPAPGAEAADRIVSVGVYQNPPMVFIDNRGAAQGLYVDLLRYISDREAWSLEFVPCLWTECLDKLETGEIDIMTAIAFSRERGERFDFNKTTLFSNWGRLYVKQGSGIGSILDLRGKRVAHMREDIYYQGFREMVGSFRISCEYIEAGDYAGVLELVEAGTADAGIVSRLFGMQHERSYAIDQSNIIFTPSELRFAFTRGRSRDLISAIDRTLEPMVRDRGSLYYRALERWVEGAQPREFPRWLLWTLAAGGGMLVLFLGSSLVLRAQVRLRTAELRQRNQELQQEIEERKRAEDSLRGSRTEFRRVSQEFNALLDIIPDNLTLQSPDLRIIWANRAATERLGRSAGEIAGLPCYELWHSRSEPCSDCPVLTSVRTGKPAQAHITTPDSRQWELRSIPVTDEEGRVVSVVEVGRDITEHRRLEEQLLQSQKMEAVGQLAGGVAHDFNNILSAIMGYASLLQMSCSDAERAREHAGHILDASRRAANLTHSLLAFSRKQIMDLRPVKVSEIIRGFHKILSRIIGEDIEFQVAIADEDMTIDADRGQIEQVLMNLATNGRDAMPQGGRLTIAAAALEADEHTARARGLDQPGRYAVLVITDTGVGMEQNVQDRIFEPFFTTKEVGKGTGLGLSMVYGIVKKHNGSLSVASEPGRGTAVSVFLPLLQAAAQAGGAQNDEAPSAGSGMILLAEDDTDVRRIARTVLEEYGYTVLEARDGDQAARVFRENSGAVDLIITDVIMPKRNGWELYEEARSIAPEVKVLFMSGYSADILQQKGMGDIRKNFIMKPLNPTDLLGKVRDILSPK